MAEICSDYRFPANGGQTDRYAWGDWLDGQCRKITVDDLGAIDITEFASYFRRRARRVSLKAHIRRVDLDRRVQDYTAVMVQTCNPKEACEHHALPLVAVLTT